MPSKRAREKKKGGIVGAFGGISGAGSVISAHNICHSVCLLVVAVLSLFGVLVSSSALMFLENYNFLFWSIGLVFLAVAISLYASRPHCTSKKLIMANSGLLLVGIPSQLVGYYNPLFWIAGGLLLTGSIAWYIKGRLGVRDVKKKK